MASAAAGGARGRRKQAKPQRKGKARTIFVFFVFFFLSKLSSVHGERQIAYSVELDESGVQYNTVLTEIAATASSMSPDTNHNELSEKHKEMHQIMNGVHKEGVVPEELPNLQRAVISGEEVANDVCVKAAVGENCDEEDIEKYLKRSDTAVIYPEPVGRASENVPTNGVVKKEGDETSSGSEYFIKCPQCQKGCQTFQSLKEHMETSHPDLCSENGIVPTPSAVSPTPSLVGPGGPFGCSQCTASFASKDQLEKHELLHSPNAQVSCKICNKTFANVYRLQRHMISHDESAVLRKFKCTECDKAFKFKHHLKEHIRIHSGEKPFECGNCGKRFSHSGSYSSHMTSKKCLVMNLKLGRTRAPNANALLEKNASQNVRGQKRPPTNPLNNNITTTNHNAYLQPMLPKYTEAAAVFLQNSLASNPAMHPFYMTPGMLNANGHALNPYMPSIGHLLEQLQNASPHKQILDQPETRIEEIKSESPKPENLNKSNSSSCGDLVMDEEADTKSETTEKTSEATSNGDLEAVKRILDTVNASVTKQFLQANMQKFSDNSSDCQSIRSTHSPSELYCTNCKKCFLNQTELDEHDCDHCDMKSEGLAAKLEDAITPKTENEVGGVSGNEEDDDKHHDRNEDYEMDSESVTTTDQLTEDGRKVRVRSLISDEQLKVLKDNYASNPRPKREELSKIADQIGFPVRVVQVWFQNTRARDRREGRLIQIPYNTPPMLPRFQSVVPSNPQYIGHKVYPLVQSPNHYPSEQPLDLSTKKDTSRESSPASSPHRPSSINHHSDSGEEVVNLSHKSSRSPTPFQHLPYQSHYQASNCSSEPRRSPSPVDFNNSSRLAHILAQPAHKLALSTMGLVPMERLIQFGPPDIPSLTQLINNRISSISPNSDKRSWTMDNGDLMDQDDDSHGKRSKVSQLVMKSLGSPMLGNQEVEIEGQFTCDQCDKAFSKQSSLARHKYEHSGQRPHKCDECPKAFKHKHHLTEHKRLHSGEKPFQCCKCLKRFSHSGSYSQHMNHRYSYCKPYRE